MKIFYTFALLILLAASCSSSVPSTPQPSLATITQEEYAVYSAAIDSLYANHSSVVVEDHTGLGLLIDDAEPKPFSAEELTEHAHLLTSAIPDVDQETISSLRNNNQQVYPVENGFAATPDVILISAQQRHDIIGYFTRQGWIGFHEAQQFHGAQGIIMLARVGFNTQRDKALVYLARQVDFNWCERFYLFFVKRDGKWILQGKLG